MPVAPGAGFLPATFEDGAEGEFPLSPCAEFWSECFRAEVFPRRKVRGVHARSFDLVRHRDGQHAALDRSMTWHRSATTKIGIS